MRKTYVKQKKKSESDIRATFVCHELDTSKNV